MFLFCFLTTDPYGLFFFPKEEEMKKGFPKNCFCVAMEYRLTCVCSVLAFINMELSIIAQRISRVVDELADKLKELALFIHSHPETAFNEHLSASALSNFLEGYGFKVTKGVAGLETAFLASFGNATQKPKVALLAEYDALPALGHACGHNLIATASCGASVAVAKAFPQLAGEIRCIGTPAEEGGGGKIIMAREGIFDGLDAVMMAHPSNKNIIFKLALGVVEVNVTFLGKSAHASAWPERGINALDAMVLFFSAINAMRQQFPPYVRVHGIIKHGGDAPNIIPERTEAVILVRALDRKTIREMLERVKSAAEGSALATGCKYEWAEKENHAYAPFHPNRKLGNLYRASLELLGVPIDLSPEDREMGSSDIGNVSERAPTIHPEFRIGPDDVVHHTEEFQKQACSKQALQAMITTAKALAITTANILFNPHLAEEIRAEFNEKRSETFLR